MDRNTWRFAGPEAELRYGYHLAAKLGPWTIDGDRYLRAELTETNPVWLGQSPLEFVWHRPRGVVLKRPLSHVEIYGSVVVGHVEKP